MGPIKTDFENFPRRQAIHPLKILKVQIDFIQIAKQNICWNCKPRDFGVEICICFQQLIMKKWVIDQMASNSAVNLNILQSGRNFVRGILINFNLWRSQFMISV